MLTSFYRLQYLANKDFLCKLENLSLRAATNVLTVRAEEAG